MAQRERPLMGWVYLDDSFPEHAKIIAAGGDAVLMWVYGLAFCNRRLTEGRIPKAFIPRLTDRRKPMELAAKLVAVGLWIDDGDHYRIHEYEKWNHSAAAKARAKKGADARWGKGGKKDAQADAQASDKHVPDTVLGDASRAPGPLLPNPSVVSSPSSSAVVAKGGEEEDWALAEARQRLANRPAHLPPVNNPPKWLETTAADIRKDGPPKTPLRVVRAACEDPSCVNGWLTNSDGDPYDYCLTCHPERRSA